MTTIVRCPVCGRTFNSRKSYDDHLPCHGPKTLGASGSKVATGSNQAKEETRTGGSGSGDN